MIYGAYGYSGRLVAEEALRRGHRPVLAGRSRAKLEPVAAALGLESVAVDLGDPAALRKALDGVTAVFHAAGPFVNTSEAMTRACLAAGADYLDITGEVPVFAKTLALDAAARDRGTLVMSGVGFDVVPTDCLAAHVAARVPGATELAIAIAGLSNLSAGTGKSMFDGALAGGLVRREGKLKPVPFGKGARRVRFLDRERSVLPIPWGDLETAYRTTGIPNITTYMAFPKGLANAAERTAGIGAMALPFARAVLGAGPIKRVIEQAIEARLPGPDEEARKGARSFVWVRAAGGGREAEGWLESIDGYAFTAASGVRALEKVLAARAAGKKLTGALTPALAFGADFVLEIEGTRRYDALPA